MADAPMPILVPWSSFYVMIGSSAAALTGLMFVVITLVNRVEGSKTSDGIATFSTPTVLHFSAALLVSAILAAPWQSLVAPGTLLGIAGFCGVVSALRTMKRTRRLSTYDPDLEDWISYAILPLLGYGTILAGAILLLTVWTQALYAIAGGAVFLIFIGIRNAWDTVTYIAIASAQEQSSSSPKN